MSSERINEVKALGTAVNELSHDFTQFCVDLVNEKKLEVATLEAARVAEEERIAKLEEELRSVLFDLLIGISSK